MSDERGHYDSNGRWRSGYQHPGVLDRITTRPQPGHIVQAGVLSQLERIRARRSEHHHNSNVDWLIGQITRVDIPTSPTMGPVANPTGSYRRCCDCDTELPPYYAFIRCDHCQYGFDLERDTVELVDLVDEDEDVVLDEIEPDPAPAPAWAPPRSHRRYA